MTLEHLREQRDRTLRTLTTPGHEQGGEEEREGRKENKKNSQKPNPKKKSFKKKKKPPRAVADAGARESDQSSDLVKVFFISP